MAVARLGARYLAVDTADYGSWASRALCVDQGELFFDDHNERPPARAAREAAAKALCARCPVLEPCREAGRRNKESGIWGGETEEERTAAGHPPRAGNSRRLTAARRRSG